MSDFYTRALATANQLIKRYGVKVTWNQLSDSAPADPNKPWKPGASQQTNFTPYVVFLDTNRLALEQIQFMSGTEIPDGYQRAIMAGNVGFTPTIKDTFTVNNKTYSLEWLDAVQPAGTPIVWKMGIKAP